VIEIVVTDRISDTEWDCMVRPGKKMKVGRIIEIGDVIGKVVAIQENGNRVIRWDKPLDIHEHGSLALPHYMGRDSDAKDLDRYQTTFAREEGAIAAPTAGLHFTPEMLANLNHDFLTLHVGVGTFRPVKAENILDHEMHSEKYTLSDSTAKKINTAPKLTAVGTTVTRVLESLGRENPHLTECSGATDIFIYPGFEFKIVDRLLTNFHLPMSTLIMLVSAFAGKELILEAYKEAVAEKYRFYSYGDCMLIL
jgi:S-adenosylmethionine:tRNA ribosyltransferase-isomerase